MAKSYLLSESDHAILQEMIADYRSRRSVSGRSHPDSVKDHQAADVYIVSPSANINPRSGTTVHWAWCSLYRIVDRSTIQSGTGTGTGTSVDGQGILSPIGVPRRVYNLSSSVMEIGEYYMVSKTKGGSWAFGGGGGSSELIGGCLRDNHPGRGTPFRIELGTWDSSQFRWTYDTGDFAMAVDWRYDVPTPTVGAEGLFLPRLWGGYTGTANLAEEAVGYIYETVDLDCSSPEECAP